MGCPGCLLSERERQEQLQGVMKKAKEYAIEQQVFVVIYDLSDGGYGYMEASAARNNNIQPIQYISHLQPVTDVKVP